MTVFEDVVKLESVDSFGRCVIGWFLDEVSAISAAAEHAIIASSILPDYRKLPELVICCEYKKGNNGHRVSAFKRATVVKHIGNQRRIVLTPGASAKSWVKA